MLRAYFGLYETSLSYKPKSKVFYPYLLDKSLRKIQIVNLNDFNTITNTCFELYFLKVLTKSVGWNFFYCLISDKFFQSSEKFFLQIVIKIDVFFSLCILIWYLICFYVFLKFIFWFLTTIFYPLIRSSHFYLFTEWHQRWHITAELPKISIFQGLISFNPDSETFFSFAFLLQ